MLLQFPVLPKIRFDFSFYVSEDGKRLFVSVNDELDFKMLLLKIPLMFILEFVYRR